MLTGLALTMNLSAHQLRAVLIWLLHRKCMKSLKPYIFLALWYIITVFIRVSGILRASWLHKIFCSVPFITEVINKDQQGEHEHTTAINILW